jgi:hypothetical protein
MKIIQSFWSLPASAKQTREGKSKGGWLSARYQYMGMALSCLLLQRYYGRVTLYTDAQGYELLIKQLGLPYDEVQVCLDELNTYSEGLWALPKIYAYHLQREPFMHIDSDVFIWGPFADEIHASPLVAQSPEIDFAMYRSTLQQIADKWSAIPALLQQAPPDEIIHSINAGVFGGNDIEFIRQYTQAAFAAIDENTQAIAQDHLASNLNIVLEQYLFYKMSELQRKPIAYVVPTLSKGFSEVIGFNKVPLTKYVHLVGATKRHLHSCQQVEYRLAYEFPRFYKKLVARLDAHDIRHPAPDSAALALEEGKESLYTIAPGLRRTSAWLGAVGTDAATLSPGELEAAVGRQCEVLDALTGQFLEDQFVLESIAEALRGRKACPERSRVRSLRKLYRRLSVSLEEEVMSWPLTTSPHICLVSTNWKTMVFATALPGEVRQEAECTQNTLLLMEKTRSDITIQDLEDWNRLFLYFYQTSFSGAELVALLNENLPDATQRASNYQNVYEFITMHLVYSGYLRIGA